MDLTRRTLLQHVALIAATTALPRVNWSDPDGERLRLWSDTLRTAVIGSGATAGQAAVRVGELAAGSPYLPGTLETYLKDQGDPRVEPLTLSLSHFDCVTLVEACLAVSRAAAISAKPTWEEFGAQVERMRYRGGRRSGYFSRLHYFSEWIADGAARGLVRDIGRELGAHDDQRPLRFMTEHRASYPALRDEATFAAIGAMERRLDGVARWVVAPERLATVTDRIETGDVLAFATSIPGLDVTHAAMAYRDRAGALRVLHAPLSGGVVEVTRGTLPDYVTAIRSCTGVLIARPLWG